MGFIFGTVLATAYGFDLTSPSKEIYLKLEQDNFMPLVLEKHEPHVFSLSHYYVQNGDLMSDPDVTFIIFNNSNNHLIYPLTYTQHNLGIYQEVAWLNQERNCISLFKPYALLDLVEFCNIWMDNIYAQDWFLNKNQPNPQLTVTKS